MPELLLDSMYWELSMNPLLPLLLMDLIKKDKVNKMFLSSILEVVLLMFPFLPLKTEFLKSKLLLEIHILEEKILIINWLNSVPLISLKNTLLILEITLEPWEDSELNVKELKEFFLPQLKLPLKLILLLILKISLLLLLELNSKNFVYLFSKTVSPLLKESLKTVEFPKMLYTKLFLSEDLLEFPKLFHWSKISSMEKNPIDLLTQMKLLHMELPFKPPF